MKFSKEQSSQLATVTFVATVLVVMCHCDDVMPNKDGLVRFLGGIFTDANVANFFFLSGFFVACHFGEKGWYLRAIGKRLRTLGTPYLGWCFIYVFGYAFLHRLGIYHPFKNILDVREAFGIGFLTHPVDFALWYIKTLFYFILAAPLFFRLQSRYRFAFPLCAILLLRFSLTSFGGSPYFGFCFNLIGFISFLMGAEMAFCEPIREAFLRPNRANAYWSGVMWLLLWLLGAIFVNHTDGLLLAVSHPLYVLFSVFCLQRLVASVHYRVGDVFIRASFVIYASHLLILRIVAPYLNRFFGGVPILCYVSLVCLSVLGGVALTEFLRKFLRPVLALLTGGRA